MFSNLYTLISKQFSAICSEIIIVILILNIYELYISRFDLINLLLQMVLLNFNRYINKRYF